MIASGGATAAELPTLYSNLGAITFNAGDYAKAAAAFKKLIELQPDNAHAKSNLAAPLAQQGNPAEAASLVQPRIAAADAAGPAVAEGPSTQAPALSSKARPPQSLELTRATSTTSHNRENMLAPLVTARRPPT